MKSAIPAAHEFIARLEASAELRRTPCGEGSMVWRLWGRGRNLVLLHGNLGSWKHWIRNIEFLATRYRVIAADIPGFGDSDLPPKPYSAESVAQIVADGLTALTGNSEPITFAGFSFGSGVAAEVARILGARVDKLVLVSAGKDMAGVTRNDTAPFVKWRGLATKAERDAAHRRNIEIIMLADPANIDELALGIQSENAAQARLNIDIVNKSATHTHCTPGLKCELAAIWGERDSTIGPYMHERTRWLHSHHPAARYTVISGAGHWCAYEQAQEFNRALLDILEAASPSRGVVDGIRVIDFSQFAAGPWCTSLLGDLGADIIKIERPGRGDPSRAFDTLFGSGNSSYFAGMNRNKRSIALDLSSAQGKAVARRLLSTADIVIENFRPGVMDNLGLGYDALRREFPRLIYCAISAYGESGPYVQKPGMDGVVQAMGGVMGHTGEPGGTPTRIGVPIADFTAAFLALSAISLALYDRERTGCGQKVGVALLDGQLALFANHMPGFAVTGKPDQPAGTAHPQIEPSRVYRTQNGHMVVTCFTQEFWQRFARTIGLPELIDDERFSDNPARVKNRGALTALVEAKLTRRPTAEWIEILERNDVPCTQVNMLRDLSTNPQVLQNRMIIDAPHPTAGTVKVIGNPLKFSNAEARIRRGAPELGGDSMEILKGCGYSDAEMQELVASGVVAMPVREAT